MYFCQGQSEGQLKEPCTSLTDHTGLTLTESSPLSLISPSNAYLPWFLDLSQNYYPLLILSLCLVQEFIFTW
jgi:hypothetical protein